MDPKDTRYQAAVVRDGKVLLLQQLRVSTGERYWLLPGGRREPGETEHACVRREVFEETGLHVTVGELLLDEPIAWGRLRRRKTYVCTAPSGEPAPGSEPEPEYANDYVFTAVRWLDLREPHLWPQEIASDADKVMLLGHVRRVLEKHRP